MKMLDQGKSLKERRAQIEKTYSKRGAEVVKRNFEAVDATLAHLQQVTVPAGVTGRVIWVPYTGFNRAGTMTRSTRK